MLPGGFEYQAQYGTLDPEVEEEMLENSDIESVQLGESYAMALTWNSPIDGLKIIGTFGGFSVEQTRSIEQDDETVEEETDMEITEPTLGLEYLHNAFMAAVEYRQVQDERSTSESYYGLCSYRINDWL